METLLIETASKQYPLYIGSGLRKNVSDIVAQSIQSVSSILIITDENVAPFYLEDVKKSLSENKKVYEYILPGGESAKTFENYYNCISFALENELDRKSCIIALGGGVIGDLAGFVAATYMRGIPFIQMPTTLLAHDSSVGGKVAVNHPLGKNMIGAFYQPEAVIYDIEMLNTMPEREWRSGYAEVIKHALIWDHDFYVWLKENIKSLADLREDKLIYALKKGISVKAAVVKEDETEQGIRSYLNFGHTLGHAIEALSGYGKISHGDAVVMGMLFAIRLSEAYYNKDLHYSNFVEWFNSYGYPDIPKELKADEMIKVMKKDKKSLHGIIRMVLMKDIGVVETVALEEQFILDNLQHELERGNII